MVLLPLRMDVSALRTRARRMRFVGMLRPSRRSAETDSLKRAVRSAVSPPMLLTSTRHEVSSEPANVIRVRGRRQVIT
jgi:hypothetical protein